MPNVDVPRLCGGTFLTQLLRMKKPPTRANEYCLRGVRDEVNNQRMLEALIRFFDPDFMTTCDDTFKTDVSAYLSCSKDKGANLPFTKKYYGDKMDAFNMAVMGKYSSVQKLMEDFVDRFIDLKKVTPPVCALLQTIQDDVTIKNDTIFYMGEMGNLTKAQLKNQKSIILENLLLGIWHFILLNRQDTTIGKKTYVEWNKYQGEGKRWEYGSDIGENIKGIEVKRANGDVLTNCKKNDEEPEYIKEDTEEYVSDDYVSPALEDYRKVFQQLVIINNNFYGAPGSTNIQNNYGNITINAVPSHPTQVIDKSDYYHLVVGYEFAPRIRVATDRALREYISIDVKETFPLTETDSMIDIPVLVMPELNDKEKEQIVVVGTMTKVKTQDNGVMLYIQKNSTFPAELIKNNMELFGVSHIFELTRTHWTIKKINLEEAMEDATYEE